MIIQITKQFHILDMMLLLHNSDSTTSCRSTSNSIPIQCMRVTKKHQGPLRQFVSKEIEKCHVGFVVTCCGRSCSCFILVVSCSRSCVVNDEVVLIEIMFPLTARRLDSSSSSSSSSGAGYQSYFVISYLLKGFGRHEPFEGVFSHPFSNFFLCLFEHCHEFRWNNNNTFMLLLLLLVVVGSCGAENW